MENPENVRGHLVKRTRLDISSKSDEGQRASFTPMAQQANAQKIRQLWTRLCKAGNYEEVRPSLCNYGLSGEGITRFFIREGGPLLSAALLSSKSAEMLSFYREIVDDEALRHVLRKDNYYVLDSFLRAENYGEKRGITSESEHQNRLDTFRVLLALDLEGVRNFMVNEASTKGYSDGILVDFDRALNEPQKIVLSRRS